MSGYIERFISRLEDVPLITFTIPMTSDINKETYKYMINIVNEDELRISKSALSTTSTLVFMSAWLQQKNKAKGYDERCIKREWFTEDAPNQVVIVRHA